MLTALQYDIYNKAEDNKCNLAAANRIVVEMSLKLVLL